MPGTEQQGTGTFLNIIQGTLRQRVDENTPNAKRRDYETPAGIKGTKYELVYKAWTGIVRDLRIATTEYGEFLYVDLEDAVLSIGLDSRYFTDFVKKFASADPNQEITIQPYDFEDDKGKRKVGLLVVQNGEKMKDHFYNFETKEYFDNFPEPDGDITKYSKDDWKIYFIKVKKFLKDYVENMAINNIKKDSVQQELPTIQVEDDEVRIEDIPF